MEKEFVTYDLALRMKQLGFDEECFYVKPLNGNTEFFYTPSDYDDFAEQKELEVGMPLFQQAFRWFREKYDLLNDIGISASRRNDINKWMYSIIYLDRNTYTHSEKTYNTYEEAELACLKKIIEIVEGIES
jgi:hypothetical protein